MRKATTVKRWAASLTIGLGVLAVATTAHAARNDISLLGLGRPASATLSDPAVQRYRALSAELALALAPKALGPAETLGMSGFEFSLASTTTGITESAEYWQGQPGSPVFEGVMEDQDVPGALWTPTLQIRKGLPISTDLGVSIAYLSSSEMFMLGSELKIALYESYIRYIPALSVRAAFGRLFGSSDLDLVTGEIDVMASLALGIGGMAQLTPYVGAGALYAHVNSQVLDETPYAVVGGDQRGGASGSLYTFPTLEWNDNKLTRVFGGLRLTVAMVALSYSLDVGLVPYDFAASGTLMSHSFKLAIDV